MLSISFFYPLLKTSAAPLDEVQWMALLRSTSAYEMYRKRGQHRITPKGVAKFLILDREFPRSIQFCLIQTERSLHEITGTEPGKPCRASFRAIAFELDYLTIEEIIQIGLHEFLDHLQQQMNGVGDKIFETFFLLSPSANPPPRSDSVLPHCSHHNFTYDRPVSLQLPYGCDRVVMAVKNSFFSLSPNQLRFIRSLT